MIIAGKLITEENKIFPSIKKQELIVKPVEEKQDKENEDMDSLLRMIMLLLT